MKKFEITLYIMVIFLAGICLLYSNSIATERLFNITTGVKFEKVGNFQILKFPDGTKAEINISKIVIYDNVPIKDHIYGEFEMRFYDSQGNLQEGKGYLILKPSQGKLKSNTVKIPYTIKFIPKVVGAGQVMESPPKRLK